MPKRKRAGRYAGRKRRRTRGSRRVSRIAKKVFYKLTETKRHIHETGDESSVSILSGFNSYPLLDISQGDTTFTRDGDDIYLTRITGKMLVVNSTSNAYNDYPVMVRLMIVGSKKDEIGTSTPFFEGPNDTDMSVSAARTLGFHQPMFAKINKSAIVCHYDKLIKLEPQTSYSKIVKFNIKMMKKIHYDGSGNSTPEERKNDLHVVVIATDCTNDEVAGNIELSGLFNAYFKDV